MLAYLTAVYFDHRADSSKPPTFHNQQFLINMFAEKLAVVVTKSPVKSYILNFLIMNSVGGSKV